jgi:hypothetical protein
MARLGPTSKGVVFETTGDQEVALRRHRYGETVIHSGAMKNITVSVPDSVYRAARVRAAERDTSVSAMVTEYLVSVTRSDVEFARLEDQQRRIMSKIGRFSASDRLERTDLHDRAFR